MTELLTREDATFLIRMIHRATQRCEHSQVCRECVVLYRLECKLVTLAPVAVGIVKC